MRTLSLCALSFSFGCAITALVLSPSPSSPDNVAKVQPPAPAPEQGKASHDATNAEAATENPVGPAHHPSMEIPAAQPGLHGAAIDDKESVTTMMRATTRHIYRSKADKLATRLKLSPAQKESLIALMDKLSAAESERTEKSMTVMQDGTVGQAAVVTATTEQADANQGKEIQQWMDSNLNPEQQENLARYREESRNASAEQYAQSQLNRMNEALELNDGQRDRLFQHFAREAMENGLAMDDVFGPQEMNLPTGEGTTIGTPGQEVSDGLEEILTPEQTAAYREFQKQEETRAMEMLKAMGLERKDEG